MNALFPNKGCKFSIKFIEPMFENAGVATLDRFLNDSGIKTNNLLNTNGLSPMLLMNVMASWLIDHSKSGFRSAMITVDSISGSCPTPIQSTYSASKGFMRNLTLGLAE